MVDQNEFERIMKSLIKSPKKQAIATDTGKIRFTQYESTGLKIFIFKW